MKKLFCAVLFVSLFISFAFPSNVYANDYSVKNSVSFILRLSSHCPLFNGYRLKGIEIRTLESVNGFENLEWKASKDLYLSAEVNELKLALSPCKGLNGKKMRIEYTFEKDGAEVLLFHDFRGMGISAGYTYTFEERIPERLAGHWHLSDYPGKDWESVAPETMGYSSEKLEALRQYLKDSCTTTSMMIVVGGKAIFSYGDLAEPVKIASCRKSLLSMLYGKYVENGTINLETTLEELGVDDYGGLLPIERKATVRNLITARSGVYHPASNGGDDSKVAPARGSVKPGSYHLYNNWDFNCAGGVFEQLTGKNIYYAFDEDIARPVGMQDYETENQHKAADSYPAKSVYLAYHFWLSTRDMARVAHLMLHNGSWNGRQVISEDWVATTTSIYTPRAEMNPASRHRREFDYGYLWWIFCKEYKGYDPEIYAGGYTATGLGGQYMTVLPALDMAIAHKDKTQRTQKSDYYKLIARVAKCKL